jgi:hypothetical protein
MIEVTAVPLTTCTEKPTVGADGDAQGLRQDHVTQLLQRIERQARRGFPLAIGDRIDTTAPDLRQVSAGEQRQGIAAAIHGEISTPANATPKNTRNSCINSGVPWNSSM